MTQEEFRGAIHENKWGIAIIGLALCGWAISLFIDDLRGKVDMPAALGALGGLAQILARRGERTGEKIAGGVSDELQRSVMVFGSGLESLRSEIREKHQQGLKLLEAHNSHAQRIGMLEQGQQELHRTVVDVRTQVGQLALRFGTPDPMRCAACDALLPVLGEPGHNVRLIRGREEHFCDRCTGGGNG